MSTSKLFTPLKVGNCELQRRLAMAPLTRFRANEQHVHTDLALEYYTQRASVPGTLIITEASFISPRAGGYDNVPGIYNAEQIKSWKKITDAVHDKGSYIYLQLWALGRAAYPNVLKNEGQDFVAPSAVPMDAKAATPRELTDAEVNQFIADYAQAAKNAVEAGFDGVEIHGANGYLIDQFTQDVSNKRTDKWGGSIENRARFGLSVAKAVVDAIGADRTGYRVSPYSNFQGMMMKDPIPQFSYLAKGLKELKLAYLHVVESGVAGIQDTPERTEKIDFLVDIWNNQSPVLVAGGFTPAVAKKTVDEEYPDKDVVVVFGRYFISNPDLPYRLQNNIDLTPFNHETFYKIKSPEGYTDYPFSQEFVKSKA